MKLIDDTLKENGAWSIARLMIFFTFWSNIIYAGWCVWKTAVFVDLPTNWLGLIVVLYGMVKTATTVVALKTTPSTVTTSTETKTVVDATEKKGV
jgi:hypothetical protein